jgi:hypothetical protein
VKGRTRWFPRHCLPMRLGPFECLVRVSSRVPLIRWMLEWDGKGFLVPFPMIVVRWRGMTKQAHREATKDPA